MNNRADMQIYAKSKYYTWKAEINYIIFCDMMSIFEKKKLLMDVLQPRHAMIRSIFVGDSSSTLICIIEINSSYFIWNKAVIKWYQ